jgi:hypothetical protein
MVNQLDVMMTCGLAGAARFFMLTPSLVDLLILFLYCAQISSRDMHILKESLVCSISFSLKEKISSLLRCLNVEFGTGDL